MPTKSCARCRKVRMICVRGCCRSCYSYLQQNGREEDFPRLTTHSYRQWTAEEVALLVALREQGMSQADIAVKLDRTLSSVKERCTRFGRKTRGLPEQRPDPRIEDRRGWKKESEEVERIVAAQMECLPDWWNSDRAVYTDWDEYDTAVLVKMVSQGIGIPAIAERLCRPDGAVYSKARKMGIITVKRITRRSRTTAVPPLANAGQIHQPGKSST